MRWAAMGVGLWAWACAPSATQAPGDAPVTADGAGDPPTAPPAPPSDPVVPDAPYAQASVVHRSADGRAHHVVDGDLGAVVTYGDGGVIGTTPLGAEPARMAGHAGRWFVTLRADGEVVALAPAADGGLTEVGRAWVGTEPFGIGGHPARGELYVALQAERAVVALDTDTLSETRRWTFDGAPRWLATSHPEDAPLVVVAFADRPQVALLDPTADAPPRLITVPRAQRFVDDDCQPRAMSPRLTGDPVITSGNGEILLPSLQNDTVLAEPDHAAWREAQDVVFGEDDVCEDGGESLDPEVVPCPPNSYACNPGLRLRGDLPTIVGKFNPVVVAIDPTDAEVTELILVNGLAADLLSFGPTEIARGVPSAIAVDERSGLVWVAMETMRTVVVMSRSSDAAERSGSFTSYRRVSLPTTPGPAGIHLDGPRDQAAVWSFVGRGLHRFEMGRVEALLEQLSGPNDPGRVSVTTPVLLRAPDSPLDPQLQLGRELFFGAGDRRMSGPSAGVSCSACHPDGRGDHLVWTFDDFSKQAPLVAGGIADTAPFRWDGATPTAQREVEITVDEQMGGEDLDPSEAAAVIAFLDSLRRPQRPSVADEAARARGEALFGTAGCDTCHSGPAFTDRAIHVTPGAGLEIDTPSLRGVGATGPWRHDGSAATLEALLATPHAAGMTFTPTPDQAADLAVYLNTL